MMNRKWWKMDLKMNISRIHCRLIKMCLLIVSFAMLFPLGIVYLVPDDQVYKNYDNHTSHHPNVYEREGGAGSESALGNTLSPKEFHQVDVRMQNRLEYLARTCSKYGLDKPGNDSLHRPNAWEFLINRKYHVIWCNVFKAASTSWMYNFNLMAGYSPQFLHKSELMPLMLARKRYPRPSTRVLANELKNSTAFLIVRHPFERLVSAYKEKFQHAGRHSTFQKLGKQIIKRYRTADHKADPSYPTFPEFVNFLIDEMRQEKQLNEHWTPITNFCTPCQVKFNVIAKFETLSEDQQYLIEKAALTKIISPQWKNKGKATNCLSHTIFSELTVEQVKSLYEIFKYDIVLFGYSADQYFKAAKVSVWICIRECIRNRSDGHRLKLR